MKHKPIWLRTVLISVILLGCGFAVARHLMNTRPQAMRRERKAQATLVRVLPATLQSEIVSVLGHGTVIPARQLELTSEVGGRVIRLNPNLVPGGVFRENQREDGTTDPDEILKIDPGEYDAALKLKQSLLQEATFNLKVEEGQQAIAKRDWETLSSEVSSMQISEELALRKPHLERARAAVEAAESAVKRAQYNRDRTTLLTPFNAIVKEEYTEKDQIIAPQTRIATLIGTDHFWVQASLYVHELKWIKLPDEKGENGAEANVIQHLASGDEIRKRGHVIRLLGDLGSGARMARVLVEIDDPLGLNADGMSESPPLLLDAYVRVEVKGQKLDDIFMLPDTVVHDGNRVWIMNEQNALEIRQITVVRRRDDSVLIRDGIREGERVVISRLPMPIPGMPLRTAQEEQKASGDER